MSGLFLPADRSNVRECYLTATIKETLINNCDRMSPTAFQEHIESVIRTGEITFKNFRYNIHPDFVNRLKTLWEGTV